MKEIVCCLVRQQRIEQEMAKRAQKKNSKKTSALVDQILEQDRIHFSSDEEEKTSTVVQQIL